MAEKVEHDLAPAPPPSLEELEARIDLLERNLGRVVAHLNSVTLDAQVSEAV